MPRRRRGRPLTGWLVVDKDAGIGSTTVVNRARAILDARKAGHCGTLDPAATGLLAIALGEATKVVPHIADALKGYRFTVAWGAATSTDDAEGSVIASSHNRPDEAAIRSALPAFTGDIEQVPPQVSAVRVDGQRAYARARAGQTSALAPRPLHVARFDLIGMPDRDHAVFELDCGKGGYVRAIARDLGAALGCLGHVTALRRLWAGPFALDSRAIGWSTENPDRETLEQALLPLAAGLADLPECRCAPADLGRLRNGNPVAVTWTQADNGEAAWASVHGEPVALGRYLLGEFRPSRLFAAAG